MTKIRFSFFIVILLLIVFFNDGCVSKKAIAKENEIINDSTSIYSIHPSRPFKYGFAYSKEKCEEYRDVLNRLNIKNGDVVADIGAASGWIDGIFSTMTDSVTFYIQDIDTLFLNQVQLDSVVKHYSSIRTSPQTNKFKLVIGLENKTNLPDSFFDKIIIYNAFHEFYYKAAILQDLTSKLKPNGQIILFDKMSNKFYKTKHKGCNITSYKAIWAIDYFSYFDFYLTNMTQPINSFYNYLTFERNKQNSDSFALKRRTVAEFEIKMDNFNLKKINSDSVATKKITSELKPSLNNMLGVYVDLKGYLNGLGNFFVEKKKTEQAINIFNANIVLFPESSSAYYGLGKAYQQAKNYPLSLLNFNISLRLSPNDKEIEDKIKEINLLLLKQKDKTLKRNK